MLSAVYSPGSPSWEGLEEAVGGLSGSGVSEDTEISSKRSDEDNLDPI